MSNTTDSVFNKPLNLGYCEPAATTDWNAFMDVVRSRRSIRVYKKAEIPEAHMRECLNAALLAPNSSNLQPWDFYWVRSSDKKAALVEACLSQPAATTASELVVCVARIDTWNTNRKRMIERLQLEPGTPKAVLNYYQKLVPFVYAQGPLGIFGLLKRVGFWLAGFFSPVPREPVTIAELKTWAVKSTALGCENLMLALRAHGYDSCPLEGLDSNRVRKLLQLPRSAVVVMVVSAGLRDPNQVYGPQIRLGMGLNEV